MQITDNVTIGGETPVLIAGPCAIESHELTVETARRVQEICQRLNFPLVFKASFDKANRTSVRSFRTIGFKKALNILQDVRTRFELPVLTDVHEAAQIEAVAECADILQVPAFLCRQTDLIQAAAKSGKVINIKKGQFLHPEDMAYAVEKAYAAGNNRVFVTERGASFGYRNLVVDMRALPMMRKFTPVVFDITHSVQLPGATKGSSGGERQYGPPLARAAAAAGVDGFFIETHPNPEVALSDGSNMIPLDELEPLLESLLAIWNASRPYWTTPTANSFIEAGRG